eukprot:m.534463 g.534463  ORF g.534463 m.534463 type:complete len:540 (-) comp22054_c0_seq1:196-1815(-)
MLDGHVFIMTQRGQIVGGYMLGETLGEGTYGKVKLGTSMNDPRSTIAVKILDRTRYNKLEVKKEVAAHKLCSNHPNIVTYISWMDTPSLAFVMLEFADGGELFDRIHPDHGVEWQAAHFYFRQLISGVAHIHSCGVSHRDIKPENILLDKYGNVKITDFGLATVFCHAGRVRKLHRKCGTAPYVAPEIFRDDFYKGDLTDYWSCGVVLIALLAGCLPWHEPSSRDVDYLTWCAGEHGKIHWVTKAKDAGAYDLLINVLNPKEDSRADLKMIQKNSWFRRETPLTRKLTADGQIDCEDPLLQVSEEPAFQLSQAVLDETVPSHAPGGTDGNCRERKKTRTDDWSSQGCGDDWPGGLNEKTQSVPKVKRESCFISMLDMDATIDNVVAALQPMVEEHTTSSHAPPSREHIKIDVNRSKNIISVTTVDHWNASLSFTARVFTRTNGKLLVDFRLIQGDGLEFKRQYARVCTLLFGLDDFRLCTPSQPTPRRRETSSSTTKPRDTSQTPRARAHDTTTNVSGVTDAKRPDRPRAKGRASPTEV